MDVAESFYKELSLITPKVIFKLDDNKVILTDIVLPYKGEDYVAMLRSSDYKANVINVDLRTIVLKYSQNSLHTLAEDDLALFLEKAKKAKPNSKAYAIVFGIEDYMLESNVAYSQNSAMMFMQYSNKILGVPDDNISGHL